MNETNDQEDYIKDYMVYGDDFSRWQISNLERFINVFKEKEFEINGFKIKLDCISRKELREMDATPPHPKGLGEFMLAKGLYESAQDIYENRTGKINENRACNKIPL